jgi:hypothetical protein
MDRRDLLKLGALAGVGGSGCASLLTNPASVGAGEMDGFLGALDSAMESVLGVKGFDRFLPATPNAAQAAKVKAAEGLTKKTMRSLLLVGTLQELPPEQIVHDGVQQRLRNSMGEFDDAMFGMTSMLEGLSPSDRANVSKALRDDPNLGMRIMGAIDEDASAFGVSFKQRTKLRAISAQACARLRQSPDLAISEYTGKVRKVEARHGARSEAERQGAAAISSALIWQGEQDGRGMEGAPTGGELTPPPPPPMQQPGEVAPAPGGCRTSADCAGGLECSGYQDLGNGKWSQGQCQAPVKKKKASTGVLTAGGIVMGAAVGSFGIITLIGAAGGNAGMGALIGATVGAIIGVIGIIVLLIGLIILATGN